MVRAVSSSLATVVRIHETGGPEALRVERLDVGEPGPGEVRLRQTAIGLNFIDTYHRSGLYPLDRLPAVIGSEGAGVVEAVGPEVDSPRVGDRVAYALSLGAYASRRLITAEKLVALPESVSDKLAASILLKGLTAWYLVRRTKRLEGGETVLVCAAAGGVGTLVSQWARALGAEVIGVVGSEAKAGIARANGCHEVIVAAHDSVVEHVRELTGGRGVDVAYDGVGKSSFDTSLECLAKFGLLVSFGNASGPVEPLELLRLAPKSVFVTRPSLAPHVAERDDLLDAASELFAAVEDGTLRPATPRLFDLEQAADAHRALEARETTGSTVLVPSRTDQPA